MAAITPVVLGGAAQCAFWAVHVAVSSNRQTQLAWHQMYCYCCLLTVLDNQTSRAVMSCTGRHCVAATRFWYAAGCDVCLQHLIPHTTRLHYYRKFARFDHV